MNQGLFGKKIDNKKNGYSSQCKSNSSFDINIFPINFLILNTHILLLKYIAANNANIPKIKFKINAHGLNFGFLVVIGKIIAAPNHPAERLINKSESACSQSITFSVYHDFNGQIEPATQVKELYTGGAIRYGPVTGAP